MAHVAPGMILSTAVAAQDQRKSDKKRKYAIKVKTQTVQLDTFSSFTANLIANCTRLDLK